MKHRIVVALVAVVMVAGCGGGGSAKADPYETYLANNPDPSIVLSREDAQARAMLGCSTKWAPGTIDAVLQDAYDFC